ncbi:MAG: hypothetical protein ABII22_02830 [Candidatus Micrarchaeota archaeon]
MPIEVKVQHGFEHVEMMKPDKLRGPEQHPLQTFRITFEEIDKTFIVKGHLTKKDLVRFLNGNEIRTDVGIYVYDPKDKRIHPSNQQELKERFQEEESKLIHEVTLVVHTEGTMLAAGKTRPVQTVEGDVERRGKRREVDSETGDVERKGRTRDVKPAGGDVEREGRKKSVRPVTGDVEREGQSEMVASAEGDVARKGKTKQVTE